MLTNLQRKYVKLWCEALAAEGLEPKPVDIARQAGYAESYAVASAKGIHEHPEVQKAIAETTERIAYTADLDAVWVLKQWKQIASADVNELVQLRRTCCRFCYGFGYRYQWTQGEYERACEKAIAEGKPVPDGIGGFGFDMNRDPNDECPECGGLGVESVVVSDTRDLKGAARKLYAGIKQTKNGIEVLTRDQDAALNNIAKYLGMLVDRKELSGPNGGSIPIAANIQATDLTDDQLAALAIKNAESNPSGSGTAS